MVNSEHLIGSTDYLALLTRYLINQYRYNGIRLYLSNGGASFLHYVMPIAGNEILEWNIEKIIMTR
jgi:hypothetical protein